MFRFENPLMHATLELYVYKILEAKHLFPQRESSDICGKNNGVILLHIFIRTKVLISSRFMIYLSLFIFKAI